MQVTIGVSGPDVVEINKGHGRIERREVWTMPGGELGACLEQEYAWPAMTWCGRIRRKRRSSSRAEEASIEEHPWIFGSRTVAASPEKIERWLRGHWTIENGVFRVLDVSYSKDRLHGRQVGILLSKVRHAAINDLETGLLGEVDIALERELLARDRQIARCWRWMWQSAVSRNS